MTVDVYSPYRTQASDPKLNAQRNLHGRTHYVSDDTLRYFHAKILSCLIHEYGLLLSIIESSAADFNNTSRIFRGVVFDVCGNVIYRPEIEHSFKTREAAKKALKAELEKMDAKQITRNAIQTEVIRNDRYFAEVRALAAI